MEFLILMTFICMIIFRGILFNIRDEKWFKTLIPSYNKYILGKLCDSKILGIIVAISSSLTSLSIISYIALEAHIIQNYATLAEIPKNVNDLSTIYITIPKDYLDILSVLSWLVIIFAVIYLVTWILLTRQFTKKNDCSTWWLILWVICPVIPYTYFSVFNKTVYIPNVGLITNITVREKANERARNTKTSRRRSS